jgi:hypothetical protein
MFSLKDIDGVFLVYPHKSMCKKDLCSVIKNNIPLYKDDDHLTHHGVKIIMDDIEDAIINSVIIPKTFQNPTF